MGAERGGSKTRRPNIRLPAHRHRAVIAVIGRLYSIASFA